MVPSCKKGGGKERKKCAENRFTNVINAVFLSRRDFPCVAWVCALRVLGEKSCFVLVTHATHPLNDQRRVYEVSYFCEATHVPSFVRVTVAHNTRAGKTNQAFPHSRMGRDLATIRATFNGKPIMIMTSHLESEKQSSDERKAQFNQVCSLVGHAPGVFSWK